MSVSLKVIRRPIAGIVLASVAWLSSPAGAQDTSNLQVWADYTTHYYKSEQTEWYADGGIRTLPKDYSWHQVYVRPSLRFHRRKHFDGHAGLGVFYTYNESFSDALELRPWQGIKFRWPILTHLSFSHYFRLEERFNFTEGENELAVRFRYKLSTRVALVRAAHENRLDPVFIPISAELFSDAGPKIDELFGSRARFDVGLGYVFNNNWVGELHLVIQSSRSGIEERLETSEYIIRFQLKHLLSAKDYRNRKLEVPE